MLRRVLVVVLMGVALRLLMGGGGGGLVVPATGIPADGSWTRHDPLVVVAPTQAWEETSIQEPNVIPDGLGWRMWYKGGWASGGATGYATSSDGVSWTHYASNPVLGRGGSSVSATISQPNVYAEGSTLYQYVNSPADSVPNYPYVYTSTDGIAWTVANGGSAYISSGSLDQWGNSEIWKEGSTYYMLQEARVSPADWHIYLLTSSSPTSGWSFANSGNPLSSLDVGGAGGPDMPTGGPIDGTYHIYYHAGSGATSGIYHATSIDRINWTIENGGDPVLEPSGTGWEIDQVADPNVHLLRGVWYMWFSAVYNVGETGRIELATAPAT